MAKPTPQMKALHALLKLHWTERRLFWAGSFNPKVTVPIDISSFSALMMLLRDALAKDEWDLVDEVVGFLPLYDAFLTDRRYAGHAPHLANMTSAIAKRAKAKAALHQERLTKVVHPMASDRTFKDGEHVSIIRTEHGWYDGRVGGRVKPGSGGFAVEGDDGMEYEIQHLRDIR